MRICSFLPSATEILFALGVGDSVVGVTHECDFPPEARRKRVVVSARLPKGLSAGEIDRRVNESMARGESLYVVDARALSELQPDLIITQDLCRVCAASPADLGSALAVLSSVPQTISLNPHTLEDVWNDIRTLGRVTRRESEAERLGQQCRGRVEAVRKAVAQASHRPRVLCLEWLDPPFIAGHWVPDMVASAGGADVLGTSGEPGYRAEWAAVLESRPEVIVLMPCGYHLHEVIEEFRRMIFPAGWNALPGVTARRVYAVDATGYFSRSGPRLAEGVEILAAVIHPDLAGTARPDMMTRLG
jgi:iron complex transport system substrate-binding protein